MCFTVKRLCHRNSCLRIHFSNLNSNNLFLCLEYSLKNEGFKYEPVFSSLRLDVLLCDNWSFAFSRTRLAMARSRQYWQNSDLRSYAGLHLCIISSNSVLLSFSNGGYSNFLQNAHTSCPFLIGPTCEQVKNALVWKKNSLFSHTKNTHKILFNRNNCNFFDCKWNDKIYAYTNQKIHLPLLLNVLFEIIR